MDKTQITLRLDTKIFKNVKAIAEKERRSLNSQIEYYLEKCVQQEKDSKK